MLTLGKEGCYRRRNTGAATTRLFECFLVCAVRFPAEILIIGTAAVCCREQVQPRDHKLRLNAIKAQRGILIPTGRGSGNGCGRRSRHALRLLLQLSRVLRCADHRRRVTRASATGLCSTPGRSAYGHGRDRTMALRRCLGRVPTYRVKQWMVAATGCAPMSPEQSSHLYRKILEKLPLGVTMFKVHDPEDVGTWSIDFFRPIGPRATKVSPDQGQAGTGDLADVSADIFDLGPSQRWAAQGGC